MVLGCKRKVLLTQSDRELVHRSYLFAWVSSGNLISTNVGVQKGHANLGVRVSLCLRFCVCVWEEGRKGGRKEERKRGGTFVSMLAWCMVSC